jgi:hypothetical protein
MTDEVNPRIEADAQIARALQIVVEACDVNDQPARDYTPDELETLFFALGTAMTQLVKIPGGKEARERYYHNCKDQLQKRGRDDLLASLEDDHARHKQAKKLVKEAFGDNVDLSPGTSGYAMMKVFELELGNLSELRTKITALADSMTLR